MIDAKNITRTYTNGEVVVPVLKGIDLNVKEGEFIAIMGKSGAGKSTLLYQISLLDRPTSGTVIIDDVDTLALTGAERTQFRLNNFGYIFQDYALLPELTAEENVAIPLIMQGENGEEAYKKARKVIENVGLEGKHKNRPNQLSGGQQQRVSIARAMVQEPKILFADEPTANLDSVSSDIVIDLLHDLHKKGQTIVIVTHDKEYTKYCDRIIFLDDGKITDYDYKPNK